MLPGLNFLGLYFLGLCFSSSSFSGLSFLRLGFLGLGFLTFVVSGSHLKRVKHSQIQGNAKIIARGGLQGHRITEQYLSEFKEYDVG